MAARPGLEPVDGHGDLGREDLPVRAGHCRVLRDDREPPDAAGRLRRGRLLAERVDLRHRYSGGRWFSQRIVRSIDVIEGADAISSAIGAANGRSNGYPMRRRSG